AAAVPVMATPHPFGVGDWAMGGHDPLDSRSNPAEHVLNPREVSQLAVKWTYKAQGDVSATPAVVGGAIYFTDWGGYLSKVDARTGKLIWDKPISGYNNLPCSIPRTNPTVVGNIVYVG